MPAQTARAFANPDRHMAVQNKIRARRRKVPGIEARGFKTAPVRNAAIAAPEREQDATALGERFNALGPAAAIATRTAAAQNPAVGGAVNTAIGSQLQRRVESGAIDDQQAQRVAGERALLEAKFGPDFREKVFGATGAFQKARTQAAANPENERLQAVLDRLLAKRKKAVGQARYTRDRNSYTQFKQGASEGL